MKGRHPHHKSDTNNNGTWQHVMGTLVFLMIVVVDDRESAAVVQQVVSNIPGATPHVRSSSCSPRCSGSIGPGKWSSDLRYDPNNECHLHLYKRDELSAQLSGEWMHFMGDSTTRGIVLFMVSQLDEAQAPSYGWNSQPKADPPTEWERLSKRFFNRSLVYNSGLFYMDELDFIFNSTAGVVYKRVGRSREGTSPPMPPKRFPHVPGEHEDVERIWSSRHEHKDGAKWFRISFQMYGLLSSMVKVQPKWVNHTIVDRPTTVYANVGHWDRYKMHEVNLKDYKVCQGDESCWKSQTNSVFKTLDSYLDYEGVKRVWALNTYSPYASLMRANDYAVAAAEASKLEWIILDRWTSSYGSRPRNGNIPSQLFGPNAKAGSLYSHLVHFWDSQMLWNSLFNDANSAGHAPECSESVEFSPWCYLTPASRAETYPSLVLNRKPLDHHWAWIRMCTWNRTQVIGSQDANPAVYIPARHQPKPRKRPYGPDQAMVEPLEDWELEDEVGQE